jgi:adenylate kinase family enzyme
VERVLVVGCAGSGKSTLARYIAQARGLPLIELDRLFWRPGWTATPDEDWRVLLHEISAGPRWVMDGNYSGSLSIRLPRADTVIWPDYPRHVCLRRVLVRTARNVGRVREGLPEGCPERFNVEFLRWIWNFNAKHRPRLIAAFERFGAHAAVHMLKSDRDAERLLTELATHDTVPINASPQQPPTPRSTPPSRG